MQSNEISVVIQGRIEKNTTKKCLESIKKFLPDAEIILSTWKNCSLEEIKDLYNVLVLNIDPGATIFETKENKTNSINRIIVSSKNGIEKATKKYVLRLRSDLILKNANILKLKDNFNTRDDKFSLFKQRIFAYDIFSIKYDCKKNLKQRMLFHISDWCYLGLKEDLLKLFDLPLVSEPEFSRYFENREKPFNDMHKERLWKMSPEQYFTSENAKKIIKNLDFKNYLDITSENINISEGFIINNFRVFSTSEWGIETNKKLYKKIKMFMHSPFNYYSKSEQLKDYKKYCLKVNVNENTEQFPYNIKYYEQLRKHFLHLIYDSFNKKFSEFLSTIFYLIKFLFALTKEVLCGKK